MVLFLILLSIYIYYNRESTNSIELFTKIFIAFIAAFLIIILDIFKPAVSDTKTVKVLILRNDDDVETNDFSDRLLKINPFTNGYYLLHQVNLFSKKIEDNKDKKTIALDLIESTFWVWLAKTYNIHWEVDKTYFEGISGGGGNIEISKNAEKETTKYKLDKLKVDLKDNYYEISPGFFWGLSLPKNTKVTFLERSSHERTVLFSNNYIQFKISIYQIGNSGLNFSNLGETIIQSLSKYYHEPDKFYTNNIIVEFNCDYSRWLKGSPTTKKQKFWVNEIMDDFYKDFDWEKLKPEIEKIYNE